MVRTTDTVPNPECLGELSDADLEAIVAGKQLDTPGAADHLPFKGRVLNGFAQVFSGSGLGAGLRF